MNKKGTIIIVALAIIAIVLVAGFFG